MTPRRFAVVGDPIGHSKSPIMHAAAFRALALPHVYEAVRADASALPAVIGRLREGTLDGLNVTVPYKERVLALVDALDESARVAGAANTIVRRSDGSLVGYNTDAPALAAELRRLATAGRPHAEAASPSSFARSGARALVLGSGGAARAAIAAASLLGIRDIVVRARAFADPDRAEAFRRTAPAPVATEALSPSPAGEGTVVAVVQATSAGMRGADPGEPVADAVAWDAVDDDAVAVDVVYSPRDTPFLRRARARGLRADDGLGMLARQGALALELWLGVDAPLEAMRASLGDP